MLHGCFLDVSPWWIELQESTKYKSTKYKRANSRLLPHRKPVSGHVLSPHASSPPTEQLSFAHHLLPLAHLHVFHPPYTPRARREIARSHGWVCSGARLQLGMSRLLPPLHAPRPVLPPPSRELAAVKLLCIERMSTATAHPWAWQEKLEARSEQRLTRGRRRPHQDKDCSVLWHDAEQDAHSSLRTSPASRGNLQARARVSLNLSATFEGAPPALAAGGARRVWRVGHRPWRQSRSCAAGPAACGSGNRHHTELSRSLAHTHSHTKKHWTLRRATSTSAGSD